MTAEPLVVRPDLTHRTGLSKSALVGFDMCQVQSWYDLHDKRPLIVTERIAFGSCVDAATEQIVKMLRAGMTVEMSRVMAAVDEVIARQDVALDRDEIEHAAERFVIEVAGNYDWSFCQTQPEFNAALIDMGIAPQPGLEQATGHPDIVLNDNAVPDVKTASKAKPDEPTVELGWYALLVEAATSKPVPWVGYLTWVRVKKPYWQRQQFEVTEELKRWTRERAANYIRARKADDALNAKAQFPGNYSMTGGPSYRGRCNDCAYNPANGGPCAIAYRSEEIA